MGMFKKAWGSISGGTAAKQAKKAGRDQARAILEGTRMQERRMPLAHEAFRVGAGQAEGRISPYMKIGREATGMLMGMGRRPLAEYEPPTAAEVAASPAVQFQMQQAQRAAEMGASARGGLFSGGHQRALARHMQGLASQEYGAESQRRMQAAQLALQQRAQRAAMLGGIGQQGFSAASNISGIRERLGANLSGLHTGLGAAQAAGMQASGQARASGVLAAGQAKQAGMGNLMKMGGMVAGATLGGPIGAALAGGAMSQGAA